MLAAWVSRALALGIILLTAGCVSTPDPRIDSLYQGRAIVTGTDERSRPRGIVEAFEEVLVKLSGDPRLLGDARVAAVSTRAATMVVDYDYRDRMEGFPIHDEQGTRDRPYDLTVRFARAAIDATLRELGREPWLAPRPKLGVFIAVHLGPTRYVLADAGERGFDQRSALLDAASRRGIPVVLPGAAALAAARLGADSLAATDLARIDDAARGLGGDRALTGQMTWDQAALRWTADWRLMVDGAERRWRTREATFDETFRSTLGIAAQILSGQG